MDDSFQKSRGIIFFAAKWETTDQWELDDKDDPFWRFSTRFDVMSYPIIENGLFMLNNIYFLF